MLTNEATVLFESLELSKDRKLLMLSFRM